MTVQNNISNQGKSFFKEFSIIRRLAQTETQPFVLQRRNQIAFISTCEEDTAYMKVAKNKIRWRSEEKCTVNY